MLPVTSPSKLYADCTTWRTCFVAQMTRLLKSLKLRLKCEEGLCERTWHKGDEKRFTRNRKGYCRKKNMQDI